MKFIDEAIIEVKAGDGGDGCVSFRREKYVPRGGPNGGDGGRGGSCILKARSGLNTLMDLKFRKRFEATRGMHGKGKDMFGRMGKDIVIELPVGTIVRDADTNKIIIDLAREDQAFIIAKGGKGGHGNTHYASSTRQVPRTAQEGGKGEERRIKLELKLLADVGLVGFPNAGKSTLISVISNAKPKIADYPFTTKVPHLGVVRIDEGKSFVMADIPGLIEGAHTGKGMGIQFLKHIERTRVLLHLIDLSDPEYPDAWKAYTTLRKELEAHTPELLKKPEIIVLTKTDLPDVQEAIKKACQLFEKKGHPVLAISAAKHEGLKPLLKKVSQWVQKSLST